MDMERNTRVHLVAFDLYYLDQRSNDYICLKDHNKRQRCKKGHFNPIWETASEPGTHRTEAVKWYKHRRSGQGFSPPLSVTILSGVGDTHFYKVTLTAILNCASPEEQLGLQPWENPSLQIYIQLKSTFIIYTCSLQPGSDAATDLVPSYHRTKQLHFFFLFKYQHNSLFTLVYISFYWTPIAVKQSSQYIWKQDIKIPTVHRTCSLEDVTAPLTDQRGKTKGKRRHFKLCLPAKRRNPGLSSHWGKHFCPHFFSQVWAHNGPVKSHFSNAASWDFYR